MAGGRPTLYNLELFEIYSLSDPDNNEVRYIGKANNSKKRYKSHLCEKRRNHYPLYRWINKLKEQGKKPILNVILKTTDWRKEEINQIKIHKAMGFNLLNVSEGGDEPFCSKETRAINGRNNARKIHSNEKSKRIWYLKKRLGETLLFLEKHKMNKQVDVIKNKLQKNKIYI
jgi:hypothetical protein